jgi:hypothetical protein
MASIFKYIGKLLCNFLKVGKSHLLKYQLDKSHKELSIILLLFNSHMLFVLTGTVIFTNYATATHQAVSTLLILIYCDG